MQKHRHRTGEKEIAKDYASDFYHSTAWKKCRKSFISERIAIDGGLCQKCKQKPGYIVHHRIHITPGNINDYEVTLNHDNLVWLCHVCHNAVHDQGENNVGFDMDGNVIPL